MAQDVDFIYELGRSLQVGSLDGRSTPVSQGLAAEESSSWDNTVVAAIL